MIFKYLKERENVEPIFVENGFALLRVQDDCLYIKDIYVEPHARKGGQARALLTQAEALAIELGLTHILGSCSPAAIGSTGSMKVMFACGFELYRSEADIIYLLKPVQKKD